MIEELNRQRLEAAARLDREAEQTSPCNETRAARIRETAAMCALVNLLVSEGLVSCLHPTLEWFFQAM